MHTLLSRFTIVLIVLILSLLSAPLSQAGAGESDYVPDEQVPASRLVAVLEQQHAVTIFYRPAWFEGETFSMALTGRTLPGALSVMAARSRLEVLFFDDLVVFVPAEGASHVPVIDTDREMLIGDPNEYGRFTRATVAGKVYDGTTGDPLIGAVVFDLVSGRGTSTDAGGHFSLEMPVGEHRLRISYIGYEDAFYDVRLISSGQAVFELFSKTSQLEEVTVTARRARENILRTQMSRIEMDAIMIRELPQTFGERDVIRSVTMLPGIQTIGEFGTGFHVRGGSADQNLILVENVPLFNSSHLFGLISVVNPDLVSDVNLMKAGIPARFGERASSVMEIKLGNGISAQESKVTGGIGITNSRLLLTTPLVKDKVSFSLAARSSYSDWLLRRIPAEELMNSHAGFYDFTAHSQVSLNKNNLLTLFGYYSFDRFGFSGNNQHAYANSMASARWNSFISEKRSSTMIVGWSHYDYTIEEKPEDFPFSHFSMQADIDYKTLKYYQTLLAGMNHTIEYGLNAIWYGVQPGIKNPLGDESLITTEAVDKERAAELAVFVSDDIRLGENMSLDVGLRFSQYLQFGRATVYEYHPGMPRSAGSITDSLLYKPNEVVSSYNGLEPRIGFRYQINQASSVKISYNRINQYINLVSNTSVMSPSDLWKLSDPYLKPLQSDQFALGYFRNFHDNTVETSAEVYYKLIHNAIEYKSGAEIAMNQAIETDLINAGGYNYGLELYVRKNAGRLTGWTSYTFSVSKRRSNNPFPENQINRNKWFPSNYDRPHNLVINMNYHISRRWRFGATFTYHTGRPVTLPESVYLYGNNYLVYYSDRNKYRLPDYHRLDVSISMGENHRLNQRGKGHWTFTIMNLYGRKNPYSVFYTREASQAGSGRSFNLRQMYIIGVPFPALTYHFSL